MHHLRPRARVNVTTAEIPDMALAVAEGGAEARTFWAGPMTLTCAT